MHVPMLPLAARRPDAGRPMPEVAPSRVGVDLDRGIATVCGKEVWLSPRESELCYLLTRTMGKVYLRGEIIARVWGIEQELKNERCSVAVLVHSLRQKLKGTRLQIVSKTRFGYWAELR